MHFFTLQIKTMAKELDIAFLTVGFDPKWAVADVPIMPKNRYRYAAPAVQHTASQTLTLPCINLLNTECMRVSVKIITRAHRYDNSTPPVKPVCLH